MIDMLFAAAVAPVAAVATTPPTVVILSPPTSTPRQQFVAVLKPVDGRCDDGALDISAVEKPALQLLWTPSQPAEMPITLSFRIDENGRVLGLKREPVGYGVFPDLSPSLAATRFASGKARYGCSIRYSREQTSIAEANTDDLIAYSLNARPRPPRELFDRLSPNGSDCYPKRPAVLLQAYPEFDRIPATAGRTDWSMVKFDIDNSGKPVNIGIHATSGNKALDKASIDAIAKSRYAKGTKKGCLYPYWRAAGQVAAPQSPEIEDYKDSEGQCPLDVEWKSKPALVYPDNFRRRAIEGWAIVAFDVAPWGATGNVKLVAAEPAAEFGEAALNIVRAATVAGAEKGYSGCFEKIRYVMTPPHSSDDETIE
ncbi:MAG: TonB family protein [Sphingomonadaceae bacterium]|nr:TonB family protein [Sphingomonadaceae bacterium]